MALVLQHAKRRHCIKLPSVACQPLQYFPTLPHKCQDFRKMLPNVQCLFWFSPQRLWSERENQQDATVRCLFLTISQHVSGIRLVLLKMGIMMPETCWEIVKNKHLTVASCWFSLSLHNLLKMHGHRNLKLHNVWNNSHSKNNSARYCHKGPYLHVKYPPFMSHVNQTIFFPTDFRKIFKYQIS